VLQCRAASRWRGQGIRGAPGARNHWTLEARKGWHGDCYGVNTEHVEVRLKRFPPHPFSTSGELPEKNPRPGPLSEGTGPPSFPGLELHLGCFSLLQSISGLQCRAAIGRRSCGHLKVQVPGTTDLPGPGKAGTVIAKGLGTEHVEARLKWFPPTPSAPSGELLEKTCGPVPFLRVPGRLLFGPWARLPPPIVTPVLFHFCKTLQRCNAGLQSAGGAGDARKSKCLEPLASWGGEGLA